MNTELDEYEILMLRIVRWLFIRLPLLILVVNGINHLNKGKTGRGVAELVISAVLIAIDIFVIGRKIRKTKKQLKDPEYREMLANLSPEELAKREAFVYIKCCIGCVIVCVGLFIVMPIAIHAKGLAVCLAGGAFLTALAVFGLVWEIKAYQHPEEVVRRRNRKKPVNARRETLYKDYELGYEPAMEQYCKQTGKSETELTDADDKLIWEYAYAGISYLLAWIAEHNFYQAQESDWPLLGELIGKIKTREIPPTDYISENDGTLYEGNIKESAIGFVKEYMNNSDYVDGHEVAKPGDIIGAYYPELEAFVKEHLKAEMYGFPFRWEDYDIFKTNIDKAYKKYKAKMRKMKQEAEEN